jgi:hypothetical protein
MATYTKQQKKEYRLTVYQAACKYVKYYKEEVRQMKIDLGENTNFGLYEAHIDFYESIKKGEYMRCLDIHRVLNEIEEELLDRIVFKAEKFNLNSEQVRRGTARTKQYHDGRKSMLKSAMICDASVGYWKLSK